MYWTAFSLLKNEADAEDIVQDTFVSFINSYSGLTDTTKAVPLLKKMAANKSLNKLTRTRTVNTGEGYELTGTVIVPNIIPAEGNAYLEDGVESFTNDMGMTYYVTDFYWTDAAETNPHPYYTLVDEAGNEYSMGYDLAPGMYWDVWGYRMFPNIVFEDVTIFVPYGAAPDDRAVEGNINELLNSNGVPANGFGIKLDEEGNLTDIAMYNNAGFTEGDLNND